MDHRPLSNLEAKISPPIVPHMDLDAVPAKVPAPATPAPSVVIDDSQPVSAIQAQPAGGEISVPAKDRPLILYAYSETDSARTNLKFFIAHGLHDAADFIFIVNGKSNDTSLIPRAGNIRVVERKNECYDLGAYAEILTKKDLYKKYKKFIMLNASIRGPFMPYWAESCWSDRYLNKITDEVKVCFPLPLNHFNTAIQ